MTTERHRRQALRRPPRRPANAKRAHFGADRIIDAICQPWSCSTSSCALSLSTAPSVIPEQTIGQHLADVGDHRLDVPALRDSLDLLQAEDAIEDYEIEIELPALGRRMLLLSAEKIRGESEGACEIVMAIDDVTERRRAETMLKSAKWHAERANLSKSRFLAAAKP
jgi:hypothetical protein